MISTEARTDGGRDQGQAERPRASNADVSELPPERILCLYEISKVLARFEDAEATFPAIVALMQRALPLRSAILMWTSSGRATSFVWQAVGQGAPELRAARERARDAYAYLMGPACQEPFEPGSSEPVAPAESAEPPALEGMKKFIALPLAVMRDVVIGAVQLEAGARFDEGDLIFVSAAVQQLALALHRKSAHDAVALSEAMFAGIVSLAVDAIITVDSAQRIILFNEAATTMFGYSKEEALGAPLELLLPERLRGIHREHVGAFAAGPVPARKMGDRGEIIGRRKDGREFPAEGTISKLAVDGRRVLTVVLRDVSERRRSEHARRFLAEAGGILASSLDYRDSLTRVADLVVGSIADLCIVDIVEHGDRIERLAVTMADPARSHLQRELVRYLTGNRTPLEGSVLTTGEPEIRSVFPPDFVESTAQDEEHRRLLRELAPKSLMAVPLVGQKRLLGAIVLISTDPTRTYEPDDLWVARELAAQASLAIDNALLYRAAQQAIRKRDDVLAAVSHDLKSPLSVILLNVALLLGAHTREDTFIQKRSELIRRSAERMDGLIHDLLDTASIEAGHLSIELRPVSIAPLVEDAVDSCTPSAATRSLRVRREIAPDLPAIVADASRVQQILANLLSNAIKFTPVGGEIVVRIKTFGDSVRFSVMNTGPGIPKEDVPRLFDRFWQARRTARLGTGLGLFIVKELVQAHGGKVWVESRPGEGVTFFFTMPAVPRER